MSRVVATALSFEKPSEGFSKSDWGKGAISVFRTTAGSAYKFQFHVSSEDAAVAHCCIIGPTGQGKTTLLTFLAGLASIALSLIIFIITTDHILLVLGSIIFLASLVLVRSLWSTIARGQYEIVEGVCSSVVSPMMRQYRKIQLIDEQGAERTLLLSKSAKFQIGARYRFYFQSSSRPTVGNDYLDAALSTNSFLGYEALGEPAVQEEQAKENG